MLYPSPRLLRQHGHVRRTIIAECLPFERRPLIFLRIEFWRIRRKAVRGDPTFVCRYKPLHCFCPVRGQSIPKEDERMSAALVFLPHIGKHSKYHFFCNAFLLCPRKATGLFLVRSVCRHTEQGEIFPSTGRFDDGGHPLSSPRFHYGGFVANP